MCKVLGISRSIVYYKRKNKRKDIELENHIIRIFKESKNNYGSRKIKVELQKLGYQVSLRRIRRYMNLNGLVSNYTVKQFKVHKSTCNEDNIDNKLNREFNWEEKLDVVVSDLTYVNVKGKWNYICLIIDLFNREIIGYAAGKKKNAELVYKAFGTIKTNLDVGRMWEQETLHVKPIGTKTEGHKILYFYAVMRPTHTYNTREMAKLIDSTVQEAHTLGIPTITDKEMERLLNAWGKWVLYMQILLRLE